MGLGRVRIQARICRARVRAGGQATLAVVVLVAGLVGAGLGLGAAAAGTDDHLTVGNTAGTLSVVLSVHGSLIVVGGGDARADLADFVDRSTLPWRRHVDLLIVPAGDAHHAAGAIGLIQHGTVGAVAILGEPGNDPGWALLQREADSHGTEVKILTGQQRLELAPGRELTLDAGSADDPSRPGPSAVLRYGQARVVIVDWPTQLPGADAPASTPPAGHVLISLRGDSPMGGSAAQVLLRAPPRHAAAAGSSGAELVGDVEAGRPVTLTLGADRIRLPAGAVEPVPSS